MFFLVLASAYANLTQYVICVIAKYSSSPNTATKAQPQTDVQTPTQSHRISPCPFSPVTSRSPLPALDHVFMPGGPAEASEEP